jgi:flagellar hook assembly protein FlgD
MAVRPNPFNPQTEIWFTVRESGSVTLTVFDDRGRRVRTLHDGWLKAGVSSEVWDGRDQNGARVAAGVYFVSLRTTDARDVAKLALVK